MGQPGCLGIIQELFTAISVSQAPGSNIAIADKRVRTKPLGTEGACTTSNPSPPRPDIRSVPTSNDLQDLGRLGTGFRFVGNSIFPNIKPWGNTGSSLSPQIRLETLEVWINSYFYLSSKSSSQIPEGAAFRELAQLVQGVGRPNGQLYRQGYSEVPSESMGLSSNHALNEHGEPPMWNSRPGIKLMRVGLSRSRYKCQKLTPSRSPGRTVKRR